jgi:hypothetical protein
MKRSPSRIPITLIREKSENKYAEVIKIALLPRQALKRHTTAFDMFFYRAKATWSQGGTSRDKKRHHN